MINTITQDSIDIFRAFYYRYPRFGVLAKGIKDYHRCFGVHPLVSHHMSLQLGSKVYEVSMEGTVCFDYDESMLEDEHIIAFYECDIKSVPQELKIAARFTLDSDVVSNRKLKIGDCLRYLRQWQQSGKRSPFQYTLDFNLPPASVSKQKFNLPYTCASQASFVFNRLFGLEPILDSHLPTTLLWMNLAMADQGIGTLWEAS